MSNDLNDPPLLDATEVAKRLKVSRPYVYKLERLGLLSSVSWAVPGKVRERNVIRFLPEDVAAFIERHRRVTT
jgi:predicted DNA-binding transcriptional regulator AlpA